VSDTVFCKIYGVKLRIPQFNEVFLRDPVSDTVLDMKITKRRLKVEDFHRLSPADFTKVPRLEIR
jgi:hypothetical protein